jgi:hypothetical protein
LAEKEIVEVWEAEQRERKILRGTEKADKYTHVTIYCRRIVTFSTIVFMPD